MLEDELRSQIPEDVFEEQIGVMVDVLESEQIAAAVKGMREQAPSPG
jgi:hypothetical protein